MDTSLRHSRHRRENPSFSSSLLDAIYRSIDDTAGEDDEFVFYRDEAAMRKNSKLASSSSFSASAGSKDDEKAANFRRACMIEKWMEKKVEVCRSTAADFSVKASHRNVVLMNSSSSSSDSSSGGGFSSSESESLRRPKPIRTSVSAPPSEKSHHHHHQSAPKPKPGFKNSSMDGFVKTKSKALKIYSELKKAKQPISPGGRLASFLNSLFPNASPRKTKPSNNSTCSSASSFSRSCLSSSSTKFGDTGSAKRSVRFGAVSVFVGDDCRPCSEKSLVDEKDRRRVQEVAIDLLKNYQKKSSTSRDVVVEEFDMGDVTDVYENDNDDVSSCSSSDLFELDNLSAIGMDYTQELPVYETTHFDTNRAIANGLIL